MLKGIVIDLRGGIYKVLADETGRVVDCRLRGRLKLSDDKTVAGDKVMISLMDKNNGMIEEVLPRSSKLDRPAVANVSQVLAVFSLARPDPSPAVIDRFLVPLEASGLPVFICFNKTDLVSKAGTSIGDIYREAGYKVYFASAVTGEGIGELSKLFEDNITVMAGPSGVGKTSLIRLFSGDDSLRVGEVSRVTGRGTHTTRSCSLIRIGERGFLVDTPGFSYIDMDSIDSRSLSKYFPDLHRFSADCRFRSCRHLAEPDCGVKAALAENRINPKRYESYIEILNELIRKEGRRY